MRNLVPIVFVQLIITTLIIVLLELYHLNSIDSPNQATIYNSVSGSNKSVCYTDTDTTPKSASAIRMNCGNDRKFICKPEESLNEAPNNGTKCPYRRTKPAKNYNCSMSDDFRNLMKKRRDHLAKTCSERKEELHLTAHPQHIFYFKEVGYAGLSWCPLYKSASSNTNAFFCNLYYEPSKCQDKQQNGANIWRFSRFLPPRRLAIPRFIVVRNPFERFLSAYRDKVEGPGSAPFIGPIFDKMVAPFRALPRHLQPEKAKLLSEARDLAGELLKANSSSVKGNQKCYPEKDNPYLNPLSATFEEFVWAVVHGVKNEHWEPAVEYCSPCDRHAR